MKFFFSVKFNLALLLGLIILAVLFLAKKGKYKEGYIGTVRGGPPSENRRGISDASFESSNREFVSGATTAKDAVVDSVTNPRETIISAGNNVYSGLNTASDNVNSVLGTISAFIGIRPKINTPQWRSVYGDGVSVPDTITTGLKPDTSLIINDGCTTKSIIKSQFVENICVTNAGDYQTLDAKCKSLSNDNCTLPACCVLINGTKCVAGDANGPTYLTDQGNEIDYKYYLHRNKCYGSGCNDSDSTYQKHCGTYANNSTGISQKCMIEMFNKAGCPNKSPTSIINEDYAYNNSKSSKQYIELDLQKTAKNLLSNIRKGNEDSRIKCIGYDNNPCDEFLSDSEGINKACMIRMYNDNGCPNTVPSLITNDFEYNYRHTNKSDLKNIIKNAVSMINPSSVDCKGS